MRTEVIVVGAGPTGLMLATELTLAGISVVVLEKQHTRSIQSRAGALQPRTAEVLDLRGLLEPLLDRALPRGELSGRIRTVRGANGRSRPTNSPGTGWRLLPVRRIRRCSRWRFRG